MFMVNYAVGAFVVYKRKVLLGKKKSDSKKVLAGKWHLPGEKVEDNESDEQALVRGLREECGLEVKVGRYIASGITPTSKREIKWYKCFALTDKLNIGSDLQDAGWFNRQEAMNLIVERYETWPQELKDCLDDL